MPPGDTKLNKILILIAYLKWDTTMYIGTIVREACFKQVLFISTLVASPFDFKGFASRGGRRFLTTVDFSFRTNLYEGFFSECYSS